VSSNLANGAGMYWVLGLVWGGSSLFFLIVSILFGRMIKSQTDGCLLALGNVVFVFGGGLLGYALVRYPLNLVLSCTGALFMPAILTGFWVRHTLKRDPS